VRHARHLSGMSTSLEAPPWPSVRRGHHFLDAPAVEEVSPWRVRYGRHFAGAAAGPETSRGGRRPPGPSLESVLRELPASLIEVVAAAVDPLEIAASLETCGLSNAVVHERFGGGDTFGLADQLYSSVEFRGAPATEFRVIRHRGMPALSHGLVLAMPTLIFAAAVIAFHSELSWWAASLPLICGWALSQFVAYRGSSRQAVAGTAGAAVIWGLLGAVLACVCLGLVGQAVLGGTYSGIAFAAAACAFATAAAALVLHAHERLIALMFVPGALAWLIFATGEPFSLPSAVVIAVLVGSVGGTVLAALRHVLAVRWRLPAFTRSDAPAAARFFANGCCCGLFLAILVVLQPSGTWLRHWPGVAAYPMMLSLGFMEWQVRSLRAGARRGLSTVYSLSGLANVVQKKLVRATLSYIGALLLLTVAVRALASARHVPVPTSLLVAGTCLSVAFFLALVVTSYGRVDMVLQAWLAGLAVFGTLGLLAAVTGRGTWTAAHAEFAFVIATSVALVAMALAARQVVLDPVSHGRRPFTEVGRTI
jgi:hypothetical protein